MKEEPTRMALNAPHLITANKKKIIGPIFLFFWALTFFSLTCDFTGAEENSIKANLMNNNRATGIVYFSNGTDLIKYDFSNKKKETLFGYQEESELGKKITQIMYPAYLKSKNKVLFIGSSTLYEMNIFESDLSLKNWKEYKNTKAGNLSLSPDEGMVAYYKHPNKLVIKKYEDLQKEGCEKIVVEDASTGDRPLWISNSEIVYHSAAKNIIKVDVNSGVQQVLMSNLFPESVSPDERYMLFSDKDSIYLYSVQTSQLQLLKKDRRLYDSFPSVWSQDGRYFLYSGIQNIRLTFNIVNLMNSLTAEKRDIYVYCLATGREEKILENENARFGGFWLESNSVGISKSE